MMRHFVTAFLLQKMAKNYMTRMWNGDMKKFFLIP